MCCQASQRGQSYAFAIGKKGVEFFLKFFNMEMRFLGEILHSVLKLLPTL